MCVCWRRCIIGYWWQIKFSPFQLRISGVCVCLWIELKENNIRVIFFFNGIEFSRWVSIILVSVIFLCMHRPYHSHRLNANTPNRYNRMVDEICLYECVCVTIIHPITIGERWLRFSWNGYQFSQKSPHYLIQMNCKRDECVVNGTARKLNIHKTMNKQVSLLPVINDRSNVNASPPSPSNRFVNDLYWLQFSMLIT